MDPPPQREMGGRSRFGSCAEQDSTLCRGAGLWVRVGFGRTVERRRAPLHGNAVELAKNSGVLPAVRTAPFSRHPDLAFFHEARGLDWCRGSLRTAALWINGKMIRILTVRQRQLKGEYRPNMRPRSPHLEQI
jgi:hypothetical protein